MLGLLSFLALNENLNAIWLNAVGMSRYIQLMRSRERDRFHQVGSICHRLEALSKQLEITIVLISQLRRNVDKDPCPRHASPPFLLKKIAWKTHATGNSM